LEIVFKISADHFLARAHRRDHCRHRLQPHTHLHGQLLTVIDHCGSVLQSQSHLHGQLFKIINTFYDLYILMKCVNKKYVNVLYR
jgi:hypothetical protein